MREAPQEVRWEGVLHCGILHAWSTPKDMCGVNKKGSKTRCLKGSNLRAFPHTLSRHTPQPLGQSSLNVTWPKIDIYKHDLLLVVRVTMLNKKLSLTHGGAQRGVEQVAHMVPNCILVCLIAYWPIGLPQPIMLNSMLRTLHSVSTGWRPCIAWLLCASARIRLSVCV